MKQIIQISLWLIIVVGYSCSQTKPYNDLDREHLNGKVQSIEEFSIYFTPSGELAKDGTIRTGTDFNTNGNVAKHYTYYDDELTSMTSYKYDSTQNVIEVQYSEEGWQTTFSKNKKVRIDKRYDEKGQLNESYWTSFDSRGNIIKCLHYNADGAIIETTQMTYDKHNNCTNYTTYSKDMDYELKQESQYNSKDELVKSIEYSVHKNNKSNKTHIYKDYQYDEEGNWTARKDYVDGQIYAVDKRIITYYP